MYKINNGKTKRCLFSSMLRKKARKSRTDRETEKFTLCAFKSFVFFLSRFLSHPASSLKIHEALWSRTEKNPIIHCPTSLGVSEQASEQMRAAARARKASRAK